jgi:hypothetical protein
MFRIAGFTQYQAAVALANAQGESNFNNLAIGDFCQSLGLFQLHSVRGVGKSALLGNYPYVKPTERAQLFNPFTNTLIIISSAAGQKIQNTKDLTSATVDFVNKVERPTDKITAQKKRLILAQSFLGFDLTKAQYAGIVQELKSYTFTIPPKDSNQQVIKLDGLTALLSTARYYGLTPNTSLYQ